MSEQFKKRLDLSFKPVTILPLIASIITIFAMIFLPVEYFHENHLFENLQLGVLFCTFLLCLNAKTDKKFFVSLALLCIILFLDEIDCGRTIFFAIEDEVDSFLSWKEIPYGNFANPIYYLLIASSVIYFLFSKSYKILFNYLAYAKISVYNWGFLILTIILAVTSKFIGNVKLEESAEFILYLAFFALIFLQSQNDEYIGTVKEA